MKSIEVISAGMHTSFQDLGRFNFAHWGCPVSGVMDEYHAKLANTLVQNSLDEGVLEISLLGPTLKFMHDALICVSGLEAKIQLNDQFKKINHAFVVQSGDVLKIPQITRGNRVYLAVHGGFNRKKMLGSVAQFQSITNNFSLQKGEYLQLNKIDLEFAKLNLNAHVSVENEHYKQHEIIVQKGPEFKAYQAELTKALQSTLFQIGKNSNRMGVELLPELQLNSTPILTNIIQPGCVQLTPSGKLIVLMKDAQVSGGYPRVLVLPQRSIDVLSQKRTGEEVRLILG